MERVMSELVQYGSQNTPFEIHLILYAKKFESFYSIPSGINLYQPKLMHENSTRLLCTIKTMVYLRKVIKKINPETILNFGERWNSLVILSLWNLPYPVYISDRCNPQKSLGRIHDVLRRMLYPKATGIILQTNIAREIYERKFSIQNSAVIGNPIRYIFSSKPLVKENIVISVGRLISSKNYDRLIRIFARIANPDWKLVIIGGDALKQKNSIHLKALVRELEMEEYIILTGEQKDVDSYLLKSKIFAFTSSSEGFPNVVGEAMSAGLPVISYNCVAGPGEMIKDGINGYLVPTYNDDLFEQKLRDLMYNEEKRIAMGKQAQAYIATNYNVNDICGKYYKFITSN